MTEGGKIREVPFASIAEGRRETQEEITAVNWLLQHLAAMLPPESATARAIARCAAWREILQLAQWEESEEVEALLEEAIRTLGSDLPTDVPME